MKNIATSNKKKVAVISLRRLGNIGDIALGECTEKIIDLTQNNCRTYRVEQSPLPTNIDMIQHIFFRLVLKILKKFEVSPKLYFIFEKKAWHCRFKNYFYAHLKDVDAVIISGGTIKYTNQNVDYSYCEIIEVAQTLKIPVMFNAMSVEKPQEGNLRFENLREHLQMDCVKMITTRDGATGVNYLKNEYKLNHIVVEEVGDPAFYMPEICPVADIREDTIGIGVIRPDIFKIYGNNVDKKQIFDLYIEIINALNKKKQKWVLFSNGIKEDQEFGKQIIAKVDASEGRLLPAPRGAEELMMYITRCKSVICGRMHACIFAYATDTPMVGFFWDDKLRRFAEVTGNEAHFCDEVGLSSENILNKLETLEIQRYDEVLRMQLKQKTLLYIKKFLDECVCNE